MYKVIEVIIVIGLHTGIFIATGYSVEWTIRALVIFSALTYVIKEISAIMQKRALKKAEKIVMKHEAMKRYKSGIGANIQ